MCGIFGAINLTGFFDEKDYHIFVEATDMVSYRGPDASGYISLNVKQPKNKKQFDVFLGHRRLSIIDLTETANQPMSDDGKTWIVFNGEIFNYLELKEELKKERETFKTKSDTEVILKIYKKYGESGFSKFNGMWAFAIVDINNKKIILSRDRFSIKPLYYLYKDNKFYFASETKQLLPFMNKKEINHEVMFKYLEQGIINYNEETFFNGIYQLKPKHNLVMFIEERKIKYNKYWEYRNMDLNLTFKDAVEKFRELFIDSVKIRLRSDVKIGALLSGGLDSSSISVIANSLHNGQFHTFSVISKERKYSEEKYIDIVSKEGRISNIKTFVDFNNYKEFVKYLYEIIYYNDYPFCGFSTIAHFIVLESLKKLSDIKVILSGQGGDEVLMGYLKYFFFNIKNLLKSKDFTKALFEIISSIFKRTVVWQFKISEAKRYVPFFIKKFPKNFLNFNTSLEPVWKADHLKERQILDIDKYSVPALTHYEDRNSMAHSLEIRLPFLDHRLVDFVLNLPVSFKLKEGWSKYILRKAIYELPNPIRWRKDKQGFIIPEEKWLREEFATLIIKIFSNSVLHEMYIINNKRFLDYYHEFQKSSKYIWYTDISRVLIAEIWARKFLKNEEDTKFV